jgi:hypothetical protein
MGEAKLLATERMTERGLWLELFGDLALLAGAMPGELNWETRHGASKRAYECAQELRMRGHQLGLYD